MTLCHSFRTSDVTLKWSITGPDPDKTGHVLCSATVALKTAGLRPYMVNKDIINVVNIQYFFLYQICFFLFIKLLTSALSQLVFFFIVSQKDPGRIENLKDLYKRIREMKCRMGCLLLWLLFLAIQTNSGKAEAAQRRQLKSLYTISEPARRTRLRQK